MATARLTAKRVEGRNLFVTATFAGAPVESKEYKFCGLSTREDVLAVVSQDLAKFNYEASKAELAGALDRLSQELEHDIVNGTVIDESGPVAPVG